MYRKIIITISLLVASVSHGQNLSQIATTDLNVQIQSLISAGDWVSARPYANELIMRFEGLGDNIASNDTLLNLYYLRAYGLFQEFLANKKPASLKMALEDLEKIIGTKLPSAQVRNAIDLKAICYESQGNFKGSAEALGILLEPPFVYQLKTSEQLSLIRRIVSNLYAQRDWNDNDKWFLRLLKDSNLDEDKMMAASALMQSAISKKDYEKAMEYLPYTTMDEPARYDISLNISFFNAARELSDVKVGRYADAAVFYALTYDKAKLVEFFTDYKKTFEAKLAEAKALKNPNPLAIQAIEAKITLAANQIKGLAKVQEYSSLLALGKAVNYQATKRMYESYWAYTQLIAFYPDSKQIEDYYYSAFLAALEIEKQEDMASLGEEYMKKFTKGKYIKNIKLQMAMFYHEREMFEDFFRVAFDYVKAYNTDKTCETIAYLMGSTWVMQARYDDLIRYFENYLRNYPKAVMRDALHYWIGLASMGTADFKKSYDNFNAVVTKYASSAYAEDAAYRVGIAAYGNQDLENALNIFTKFIKTYPQNELAGEAEFFLGDLYVAMSDSDSALEHYGLVDSKTSNQDYIDNSYIQSISIYNQSSKYKEIIETADKYIEKYPNGNVPIMLFEKANALNETGRQGDTLLTYKDIILKYGDVAAMAGADKAIEKYIESYEPTKEKLQATKAFIEEALIDKELLNMLTTEPGNRYRYFLEKPLVDKAVYLKFKSDESFSVNLLEDDKPLRDLLSHVNNQIDLIPSESPVEFFNTLLEDSKDEHKTLEFRAMMALDKFLSSPIPARSFNVEDYVYASPSTLIWIATLKEKYSAQESINTYQYILDSVTESQYIFEALMGMAQLYTKQAKYDEAVSYYERLENEFSGNDKAWLATMQYGETLALAGKNNLAKEKFENIRRNPAWRGEAAAGALYNLGLLSESEKKYDEAINYYDNCAIGHSNFVKYSGKSALAEIKLYQKIGDSEKAKETAQVFLSTASAKLAPEYQDIVDISNNF